MNSKKSITVIGNYSGRNAGDAAILSGIFSDISRLVPDVVFEVPTINTKFISETYKNYQVKPIGLMPWNLSIKMLGIPTLLSMYRTDLTIITDAILFDRKLYNPIFNYLSTLSLLIPLAKKKGKKVILYNVSLGPVDTDKGKKMLTSILNHSDQIILRDVDSLNLLKSLEIIHPQVHLSADSALNNLPASKERVTEIIKNEGISTGNGLIGFNINSYIDVFIAGDKKSLSREKFTGIIAEVYDRLIDELGVEIVFIITQHMDVKIAEEAIAKIKNKKDVKLISNKKYTHNEIMGIMGELDLLIGMRTHSLILTSAMCVPVVGIIPYPKSRSYMREIGQEDKTIEFTNFNVENLLSLVKSSWGQREQIKEQLQPKIRELKETASGSANLLVNYFKDV
ncbi:MAG: polysaccharide pyruvyl transferase family protein [Candidatus Methanoperedens sp.]|nr:polysaccharide pyruvyl transferase family protein [Candidatus Methanoperedens sp.]